MRWWRNVLRLVAGVLLSVVTVGAPVAAWSSAAPRWPDTDEWRRVWRSGRVDTEVVIAIGAVLFAVLWVWFVATVVVELVAVIRHRDGVAPQRSVLRRLVRFVALSTVVTAVSGPAVLGLAGRGAVHAAVPVGAESLDAHRDIAAASADPSPDRSATTSSVIPFLTGFGSAFVLAGGVLAVLGGRRRAVLRSAVLGDRVVPPSLAQVRAEMQLRAAVRPGVVDRLDLAVRSVARHVAAAGSTVLAVTSAPDAITVVLAEGAGAAPAPWCDGAGGLVPRGFVAWRLDSDVPDRFLTALVGDMVGPCPALVHLGSSHGALAGELFVDVEAVGALLLATPHAPAVARHVSAVLASTLTPGTGRVITVGLPPVGVGDDAEVAHESVEVALAVAARATVPLAAEVDVRDTTSFSLRALGSGEAWEPVVVVSSAAPAGGWTPMPGRGVGLIAVVGERDHAAPGWYLRATEAGHVLEPLGLRVTPVGLSVEELEVVGDLVDSPRSSLEHVAPVVPIVAVRDAPAVFVEPQWRVMVRLLGPVQVTSNDGQVAEFHRRKPLELLVWLTQHRARPTRSAARAALWDGVVNDASFLNTLSEVRRRLTECAGPIGSGDWVGRNAGDLLPLHESVVTDDEIVSMRLAASRGLLPEEAVAVLQPAVELIVGAPFGGTDYLWLDAEGAMSSVVVRAIGAASELARHQLALGDVEGVFWATGQGLKVLPGHEELVALRMRAHARSGDLAGVRHEWSRYLAALAADTWSGAEPSPKLAALRAELLAGQYLGEAFGGLAGPGVS